MRYIIKMSYDGSGFCGWQIQPHSPSVQQKLQEALSTLLREPVQVTGAGRTDTGVNASVYAAHFDTVSPIAMAPNDLTYKLNAILPRYVAVHSVEEVPEDFHARFSARSREYRYFINRVKDPFVEAYSYRCGYPMDINLMNEAAALLLGTRDFSCFEKSGGSNATSVCTVTEARWAYYTPDHVRLLNYPGREEDYLVFTVKADRFLRNMVRAIVGSLMEVGRGRRDIGWFANLLESGTRSDAGESVPGKALFLCGVEY